MNVRIWTRIIGITTIALGVLSLITDFTLMIITDFFNTMHQQDLKEFSQLGLIKAYLGIPIHILLVISGIYFLQKKSFSLSLMFTALIISMLSELIPFNPFGPIYIHLALFIGAYEIRNYYYLSANDIQRMKGNNSIDLELPEWRVVKMTLASIAFVFIPVLLMIFWFNASSIGENHEDKMNLFNSFLPEVLTPHGRASMLSIILCLCSLFFSLRSLNSKKITMRIVNLILTTLAGVLLLMNIWSLM